MYIIDIGKSQFSEHSLFGGYPCKQAQQHAHESHYRPFKQPGKVPRFFSVGCASCGVNALVKGHPHKPDRNDGNAPVHDLLPGDVGKGQHFGLYGLPDGIHPADGKVGNRKSDKNQPRKQQYPLECIGVDNRLDATHHGIQNDDAAHDVKGHTQVEPLKCG